MLAVLLAALLLRPAVLPATLLLRPLACAAQHIDQPPEPLVLALRDFDLVLALHHLLHVLEQ
eukprot:7228394-Prymnesium_polylepis.1